MNQVKAPYFVLFLFFSGMQSIYGQSSCVTAIPLLPGFEQCGSTDIAGNGISNNDCLGPWDDGNDYLFSFNPTTAEAGLVLIFDVKANQSEIGVSLTQNCPEGNNTICLAQETGLDDVHLQSPPLVAGAQYFLHISSPASAPALSFCLSTQLGSLGCTNPLALNFEPLAVANDGSCLFPNPLDGCVWSNNAQNLFIPDGGKLIDTLSIAVPANAVLTDLDLVLHLVHDYVADLKVTLTGPAATTVLLFQDLCPQGDTLLLRLDDASAMWDCDGLNGGFFSPPGEGLSLYNGQLAGGDWMLTIEDDALGDAGYLFSWCLIPEWEAVPCLSPSALMVSDVSSSSAILTWNETNQPPAEEWEIELVKLGESPDGNPDLSGIATTSQVLNNLEPATTYLAYVRAKCGAVPGSWSNPRQFTTAISNPSTCGLGIPIADCAIPALSQFPITIANAPGNQLGVDVFLKEVRFIAAHDYVSDIDFFLISPAGVTVELTTDNGGGGQNMGVPGFFDCQGVTIFSQEACRTIDGDDSSPPFLGAYKPEGDLTDFYDGSSPLGNWTLVLCDDAGDDSGTLEYIELVFDSLVCTPPPLIGIDSIGAGSVFLSWISDGGDCQQYIIEYGLPGFIPGSGYEPGSPSSVTFLVDCGSTFPIMLSGLEEAAFYEMVIRKECAPDVFSVNGCPISFITNCESDPPTALETLDNEELCSTTCGEDCFLSSAQWQNTDADDFDWIIDEGKTPTSRTGPEDDISGGGRFLYIETSNTVCPEGGKASLVSNCIFVSADTGNCHFSFYYYMFGDDIYTLHLLVSEADVSHWDTIWMATGDKGERWYKSFIDLSPYNGKVIQLRFDGYKGMGIRGDIAIDHFTFYGSTFIGKPDNTYFADFDGDGFGSPEDSIVTCGSVPPVGFVANNLDCNDYNPDIHPGENEIPCNGIDENCNGNEDDTMLDGPLPFSISICFGRDTLLSLSDSPFGNYYWKAGNPGGEVVAVGSTFAFQPDTSIVYWVLDSLEADGRICKSVATPVSVFVLESPAFDLPPQMVRCPGEIFDLSSLDLPDTLQNGNSISFFYAQINGESIFPWQVSLDTSVMVFGEAINDFGCRVTDSIELLIFSPPVVNIMPPGPVSVCTGTQTFLSAEWQTAAAAVNLEWSNGFQDSIILISGSNNPGSLQQFSVEVTDEYGCVGRDTIEVITNESISSASVDQVFSVTNCNGSNGAIIISPLNGHSPYSFEWSGPVSGSAQGVDSTIVINSLKQGIYRVTVTDSSPAECPFIIPLIVVNGPSAVVNQIQVKDVTCFGSQDGAIFLQVSGNNPQFSWSTGSTAPFVSGLSGGMYHVTIQDGSCSLVLENIQVEEPDAISLFDAQVQDVSCNGNQDGSIQVSAQGGRGGYLYQWSNGIFDAKIKQLDVGSYFLTVTDFNGCQIVESFDIDEPDSLFYSVDSTVHLSCPAANDGQVFVTTTGGIPPYSYAWQDGQSTEDISGLQAGFYMLALQDAKGCTFEGLPILIDEPSPLSIDLLQKKDASCNGVADGELIVGVSGGNAPYSITWNHGASGSQLTGLSAGNYMAIVTDTNGCTAELPSVEIISPEVLNVQVALTKHPTCKGRSDGEIQLSVFGGLAPYEVLWSTAAEGTQLTNLDEGFYSGIVTDGNGCFSAIDTIELTAAQVLTSSIDFVNHLTCQGADDGQIFISVGGGTAPYGYEWSDNAGIQDRQLLMPGKYNCTITDVLGCRLVTPTVEIEEPPLLKITLNGIEPVLCNGLSNGSIDVSVSGGVPPYQYSWDNGSKLEDLQEAPAGTYKLTVLDKNACLAKLESITLPQPGPIDIQSGNFEDLGCSGNNGGSLDISVSGGTQPYNFQWSNGVTDEDLLSVEPGPYGLTITDGNQCKYIQPTLVVFPPLDSMIVAVDSIVPVSCFGQQDGRIEIRIEGGSPPYQYLWNIGVDSTLAPNNLGAGNYQLTVTDSRGCTGFSEEIMLTVPQPLSVFVSNIQPPVCPQGLSGSISINIGGGTMPYEVVWKNDVGDTVSNQQNPTALAAGSYTAYVTDANECAMNSVEITLPDPTGPDITVSDVEFSCTGDSTGQVIINTTGGIQPFNYLWNNGSQTKNLSDVPSGMYQLTITDAKGCTYQSEMITIEGLSTMPLTYELDSLKDIDCYGEKTGYIRIQGSGGTSPYQFSWNNGSQLDYVGPVFAGNYFCTITDMNGCKEKTGLLKLLQPDSLLIYVEESIEQVTCPGGNDGIINIGVFGGTAPFSYFWSNGSQESDQSGLSAGIYSGTITDALGCQLNILPIEIDQPSPFFISSIITPAAFGQSNGGIGINVTGATPPYQFNWDQAAGGQQTAEVADLTSGNYTVTITDFELCDTIVTFFIDEISSYEAVFHTARAALEVYPNPAHHRVSFKLTNAALKDHYSIQIHHTSGAVVESFTNLDNPHILDVSDWSRGAYYYILYNSGGVMTDSGLLIIQ